MEEYSHAKITLRYRTHVISLGWGIRNYSVIIRTRGAGQKLQPVSSNKDSSLQKPGENASLSKLQCITSHGDCHLSFLTNTFDIYSKLCLFYLVSFKSVTVHDNYHYENFTFSIFYVTSSATSREIFPTQHILKYVERTIDKREYLLFRRCKLNIKQILRLILLYSILCLEF
jgi:hypothetical protein